MAGREHQAQQVVTHVVVDRRVKILYSHPLPRLPLETELPMLAFEPLVAAQEIDRTMLRGGHEPGARVARDARLRPLPKRGDQSIVSQIRSQTDVTPDPRETGDTPGRFGSPYS